MDRPRVRRTLKEEGLQKEVHFPRPHLPETGNLSPLEPDQRGYADLTYVGTTGLGPVPMMVVLEACAREMVGHELLCSCGTAEAFSLVGSAALAHFPKGGPAPLLRPLAQVYETEGRTSWRPPLLSR